MKIVISSLLLIVLICTPSFASDKANLDCVFGCPGGYPAVDIQILTLDGYNQKYIIATWAKGVAIHPLIEDARELSYLDTQVYTNKYPDDRTVFSGLQVDPLAQKTIVVSGTDVNSMYDVNDVVKALKLAVKHIPMGLSHEDIFAVYTPPAEAMRQAANEIEQREKDIEFIKKILKALEE